MLIIGLDIGTTTIAGSLIHFPEKRLVKLISMDSNAKIPSENDWEKIQNPILILDKIKDIVNSLKLHAKEEIFAIGISGQMHGILYVDCSGMAISPLYTWQDTRASITGRNAELPVIEQLQIKTGHNIPTGYGIPTHYYNFIHGLVPENFYKLTTIGGFIAMQISNSSKVCVDPSEGASLGYFDPEKFNFDTESIKNIFPNTDFLPEVVPFYTIAGRNADSIPVFFSLGDNQASFIGATDEKSNCLVVNLGTSGQISCLVEKVPVNYDDSIEIRPFPYGHLVVGASLSGGRSFTLLAEFFKETVSFFGREISMEEIYNYIDKLDYMGGSNNLKVEPYFLGTRKEPYRRGIISGIGLNNFNVRSLLWAFSEGIVLELFNIFKDNGLLDSLKDWHLIGSGNGIRKNPMIANMVERIFGIPVTKPDFVEEACYGSALYAWQGITKK